MREKIVDEYCGEGSCESHLGSKILFEILTQLQGYTYCAKFDIQLSEQTMLISVTAVDGKSVVS